MTGRILERYTGRNGRNAMNGTNTAVPADENEIDDLGCFGWLRGIRDRALSLELRRANGNIVAIPYHTIERFEFDPSDGILLACAGRAVRLKGRNLNAEVRPLVRLWEGITRHKVPWVCEADPREGLAAADAATVIYHIEW